MKVSIITHPLWGNYGGMLQAYALQTVLQDCTQIKAEVKHGMHPQLNLLGYIKYLLRKLQLSIGFTSPHTPIHTRVILDMAESFRTQHVECSDGVNIDKYVVGSDQVWRKSAADYIGGIRQFFLDFATKEQRNRSIAYAASFGTAEWEGSPEETKECVRLLREFKAVSVREHSGVKICKEVFGVDAVQMPDPTLLLHPEDYGKIIDSEKTWLPDDKYAAVYVLDETESKAELLQLSAKTMNIQLQHLMPHATAKKRRDRFPISVPQWLRLIRDCEYFITDSFHGCVFAIIFNKPFVCLGNEGRGNARFDTLLGTFGLEDRIITGATPEKVMTVLNSPIDWKRINTVLDTERKRGINFLKENLT